jgi:hypothetical protein
MIGYNRPIISRELKLMLKAKNFDNGSKTIKKKVIPAIKSQIQKQGGNLYEDIEENECRVWYLDTQRHELNRNHNFFLRIREEQNRYDITLKCRHPDRYISASYDLSHPADHHRLKFKGFKFEEDITTPFYSKFSSQAKFEDHKKPEIKTFQDIISIYPDLKSLTITPDKNLKKVNKFVAKEISYKLGDVVFGDGNKIVSEMSMWYLSDKDKHPVIVELDFDCNAQETAKPNQMSLEEFPLSLIKNVNNLYSSLQREKIVDLGISKTKTEFAYGSKGLS